MSLSILKGIIKLVILLIVFECVTPVFANLEGAHHSKISLSKKENSHSLLSKIAFEKAEEEERVGQDHERHNSFGPANILRVVTSLTEVANPRTHLISFEDRFDSHPQLFKLYKVFLI